jgi:pimeloyl-ACP methyl ester carboxylesterase
VEFLILEACAALFLLAHLLRPVCKGLWSLDGIVFLPLLSFGLLAGSIPAYGFRPECVPLLVFAFCIAVTTFHAVGAVFSRIQNDDYRDKGPVSTVIGLVLFVFTAGTALCFAPPLDDPLYSAEMYSAGTAYIQSAGAASSFQTMTIQDGEMELWLRIYALPPENEPDNAEKPVMRPLIALIPPAAGSVQVTDAVCAALRDKGFTVLCYSRPGFDSPAVDEYGTIRRLSPAALYRLSGGLFHWPGFQAASGGGYLENARMKDIVFLLKELSQNQRLRDLLSTADLNRVFLAGYGAGGSALTALSGAPDFKEKYGQVKAVIAVENIFPPAGGEMRPRVPVMFIVSDRVIQEHGGRYAAITETAEKSPAPVLIAALSGAGPFDYSDSPRLYPVYSFLFRGLQTKQARNAADFPVLTAALMANFAAFIMTPPEGEQPLPVKTALSGVYLKTGGVWNLGGSRGILQP